MASETITRNDLTAILNEVLPPSPSEYKKLLWTNSSPTLSFAPTTLLDGTDLTVYDEIEVHGINYTGYTSIMPIVHIPIGSKGNLIGLAGSTGDSAGIGFLVARGIRVNSTSIVIAEAMGVSTNGSSWSANNNNMIPTAIYGIKYERVNPPQVDVADCVVEQGTSGIWTYRKWNSGIAEAWAYQEGTANSSGDLSTTLTCPNFFITSAQLNAVASGWGYGNAWGGVYHVHPMVSNGVWIVDTWIRNASANSLVGASWQVIGRWK